MTHYDNLGTTIVYNLCSRIRERFKIVNIGVVLLLIMSSYTFTLLHKM
jgi:hypothetical protein